MTFDLIQNHANSGAGRTGINCGLTCVWAFNIHGQNASVRKEIIRVHLSDVSMQLSEEELQLVANKTEGFSGSDMVNFVPR